MRMAHVDLPVHTDEELRAAWHKCRNQHWPDTFEETMTDPMRARMVDVAASSMARSRASTHTQPAATLDVPTCRIHAMPCDDVRPSRRCANCTRRPPPAQRFTPPPGFIDRKRAAAGDRDDD